ncbi:MAG TPA: hypothetical protein VIG72_01580, partial [Pontibacter sp.]
MYKIAAVVWCLLLWLPFARAQQQPATPQAKVVLRMHPAAADVPRLRSYSYQSTHPDSVTATKEVRALVYQLHQDAYLLASADSMYLHNDTLHVKLHIGERFEYARLRNGNLSEGILIESGFREKFYRNVPF